MLNDPGIYLKTPLAPPLAAGASVVDPTFGTTIYRLTDPSVLPGQAHLADRSTVRWFNADGTRLIVRQTGAGLPGWLVFAIGDAPVRVTKIAEFSGTWASGLQWDPVDPDRVYRTVGRTIIAYRFSTGQNTLLINFTPVMPGTGYASLTHQLDQQIGRYHANCAASGAICTGQDCYDYVGVFDAQVGQIVATLHVPTAIPTITGKGLHGIDFDNSGRYVMLTYPGGPNILWEWATGRLDNFGYVGQRFGGHHAFGDGIVLNPVNGSDLLWRDLALPSSQTPVLTFSAPKKNGKADWYEDKHFTRVRPDGSFIMGSYVTKANRAYADQDWRPLMEEIVELTLAGNLVSSYRRLCHHRNMDTGGWPPHPAARK